MTRIALLRHFPTDWNAEQRLQGQTDTPLNDAARSALAGLRLPREWRTARIISSPLSRAEETARLLAEGQAVYLNRRLIELSWGNWEGKRACDLLADASSGFRPTHEWGMDTRAPNGESAREAWVRALPALREIAENPDPAVIVTHKALMRLIIGRACDWQGMPEIKRARLYPMTLRPTGLPRALEDPIRLEPR